VLSLIDQLRLGGTEQDREAFLGVNTVPVAGLDDDRRREHAVSVTAGAFVVEALADRPAAAAGLLTGDVIVSIGGAPVIDSDDVSRLVAERAPGDQVVIGIVRRGDAMEATATLGSRQGDPATLVRRRPVRAT
jgi:serine protease Do